MKQTCLFSMDEWRSLRVMQEAVIELEEDEPQDLAIVQEIERKLAGLESEIAAREDDPTIQEKLRRKYEQLERRKYNQMPRRPPLSFQVRPREILAAA